MIAARTGINDPNIFFKRIHNRSSLEEQIGLLRRTAETKLEQLKNDAQQVEAELEEVRLKPDTIETPNLSQLNPNLSQLNPNLSQLNPNLSQLNLELLPKVRVEASLLGGHGRETYQKVCVF